MPDSPPRSIHNSNNQEQHFAIGVTRVCIASGTLQIPFAMRGVLEPGTYLAHDTQLDEAHELDFEPPRSLVGLDAVFAAHELQPNDEVLLKITKDGLELDVKKRPRRKTAEVKGEPWESVRGAGAGTVARASLPRDGAEITPRAETALGTDEAAPNDDRSPGDDLAHEQDPDAPRMVRVRRIDKGRPAGTGGAKRGRTGPAKPDRPREARPGAGSPTDVHQGRVRERGRQDERSEQPSMRDSAAQRFYEDPGYQGSDDADTSFVADEFSTAEWGWERSERLDTPEESSSETATDRQGGGFFAKIARTVEAAKGAFSFRGAEREQEYDSAHEGQRYESARYDDVAGGQPEERVEYAPRTSEDPRASADSRRSVTPPTPGTQRGPVGLAEADRPGPPARSSPQRHVVIEDAEAGTMDQHGPPMWDLGEGDLRQRLIRFLQHPDVPVILRTEMVARNFGLGEEVADAMLEDLTNDTIDGLVVTKVRDETYRISRAPTKL